MKVYVNPGHDTKYDSGAVNPETGLRECDVVAAVGELVRGYLEKAGCEVMLRQSDNLFYDSDYADRSEPVVVEANNWGADIFVSLHCNACNGDARGTEEEIYNASCSKDALALARCIQAQIVNSLGTVDRGVKDRPNLIVLKHTDMPACLVEMAFIDNDDDAGLLTDKQDEFARAIARGVTDYEQIVE